MDKEEQLFEKRLIDLAKMADHKNIVTFTDFLNLNQLNIYHSCQEFPGTIRTKTFGGYDLAERQMAAFIPDALYYDWSFPVACIEIIPLHEKYADRLTHRDYLGSILGLGIDRGVIGDIIIEDNNAFLFCEEKMSQFITAELRKIKHTNVSTRIIGAADFSYTPKYQEVTGTVASVRLDGILALAFPLSRSKFAGFIKGKKVFVNGRMVLSSSYQLKEGDIISVRGMGKFIYQGTGNKSRKGRIYISLYKYI